MPGSADLPAKVSPTERYQRLLKDGFYPNAWKGGNDAIFTEWHMNYGVRDLSDRRQATHVTGSVSGTFLLVLGDAPTREGLATAGRLRHRS